MFLGDEPRQLQGQSTKNNSLQKKSSREEKEGGQRRKKKKINEWVCCDSGSRTGTIITIHQDNE